MATQAVKFDYDPERNILFVEDDYEINNNADVDAFLRLYLDRLNQIGRKVYIVTSIDGLRVRAKAYDYYGQQLKALAEQWYLGLARWGSNPISRMTVRSSSLKAKFDINIFDTRERAIEAVELMKKQSP